MLPKDVVLSPNENNIFFARKHWVIFREPFVFAFFFPFSLIMLSFIISAPALEGYDLHLGSVLTVSTIMLYLALPIFMFGFIQFIWRYFVWSKTYFVLTTRRVIVVDQKNPFSHEIHQTTLDKIQDVVCEIKGVQAVMYGFGDIDIKVSTANESRIRFPKISKPKEAQKVIMELLASQGN